MAFGVDCTLKTPKSNHQALELPTANPTVAPRRYAMLVPDLPNCSDALSYDSTEPMSRLIAVKTLVVPWTAKMEHLSAKRTRGLAYGISSSSYI